MVLPDGRVESCGNFHGAPVALACDFLAIAAAEVGAIAERRTDRLLDASRSHGLPPFLADDAGVELRADDRPVHAGGDGRREPPPGRAGQRRLAARRSAMQEDHVSMGWGAARKLRTALANLGRILAVELAARRAALDLRAPLQPAPGTGGRAGRRARSGVAGAGPDRWLAPELAAAEQLVRVGRRCCDAVERRGRERSSERPRAVRAPRGTELSCRGWPQEAALRMLHEQPRPRGRRAARTTSSSTAAPAGRRARGTPSTRSSRTLRTLADDETLLVQSGKPVGVFRTHEWAPRVLIANSNLVPATGPTGTSSAGSRRSG